MSASDCCWTASGTRLSSSGRGKPSASAVDAANPSCADGAYGFVLTGLVGPSVFDEHASDAAADSNSAKRKLGKWLLPDRWWPWDCPSQNSVQNYVCSSGKSI